MSSDNASEPPPHAQGRRRRPQPTHFVALPVELERGDYAAVCAAFEECSAVLDPSSRMGAHRLHFTVAVLHLRDAAAVERAARAVASLQVARGKSLRVPLSALRVLKRRVVCLAALEWGRRAHS